MRNELPAYKKAKLIANAVPKERPTPKAAPVLNVSQKMTKIAFLSETILEDPHPSLFYTKNDDNSPREASKMSQLLDLADEHDTSPETSRLALISLLAVFQDILPSYRIRLPTQQELQTRVSKEVKKVRDYERALLQHYQTYLKLLSRTWNTSNNLTTPTPLSLAAMTCLCSLLRTARYFNFRSNILSIVIRHTNHSCPVVSDACLVALRDVFVNDRQGEITREAVGIVASMIKNRRYRVKQKVLDSFLSLPLRVHRDELAAVDLLRQTCKKKRKKKKDQIEEEERIKSDMKEADAEIDKAILIKMQGETLHTVTLVYFSILKAIPDRHAEALLPSALKGLGQFVHLINIDAVVDLLDVLKQLMTVTNNNLGLDSCLECVRTAFMALTGPGKELKIDVKEFVLPLYNQIDRIAKATNCQTKAMARQNTPRLLKCLSAAFITRREYSQVRLASFFKKIAMVALHTSPSTSCSLLSFERQLLLRYPQSQLTTMLENEQDKVATGVYDPSVEDPEHANPFAASSWEFSLLKFSVFGSVRREVEGVMTASGDERWLHHNKYGDGGTGDAMALSLFDKMINDEEEGYFACPLKMKRHPLSQQMTTGKRKRVQFRFIKPRNTGMKALKEYM